ncbi:MAG: TraB/GumN family protein [Bacteroidota bacterium]
MKQAFLFSLVFLLFVACNTHAKQSAALTKDNKSLLWRVNKKGIAKNSYLFGTIHVICKEDYLWTDSMKQALKQSESVCFEMDISDKNTMYQAAIGMLDKSGKQLKDYFSAAEYKKLETFIKDSLNMGMGLEMFQQMKPTALLSLFATKNVNCSNSISYEETILATAQEDKKTIDGLEQMQEQLALFDNMPIDSVVKDIVQSMDSFTTAKNAYAQMLADYKNQDLPRLYEAIQTSKELGDDMGAFLDDRNQKWIGRMEDKMKSRSVFFAVGAGHLWGEKGVINLLRKAGYTVEPVK